MSGGAGGGSVTRYRWQEPGVRLGVDECGGDDVLRALLGLRGLATPEAAAAFLRPRTATLGDPFLMAGITTAVERLGQAHRHRETVAIFGDYDVDGLTSTALLCRALDGLGFRVRPYIPHRVREGYGLNAAAIDRLADEGVTLLVAVDCGIGNRVEVAHARTLGIDTIVLDHHHVPPQLPEAVAVVNPRQDGCAYPYRDHAAVGVAYTLVRALVAESLTVDGAWRPESPEFAQLPELVALGTVADVAPLTGENRTLVYWGLRCLRDTTHPGLVALCAVAGVDRTRLRAWEIGHALGPRLNAAGRIADPAVALRLLLTADAAEAHELARELDRLNRARQRELGRILDEATALVEADGPPGDDRRLLQLDGSGWTAGVVGLVAGRLTERYGRPVVVLERGDLTSTGSARSIDGFNMVEALDDCADLLDHYGGHARAAGLTVATARLPELRQRLLTLASARLSADQLRPALALDLELPAEALNVGVARALDRLEPFGHGNPEPLLLLRGVKTHWPKASADGKHLFFTLRPPAAPPVRAVAFGQGTRLPELTAAGQVDLAGTLRCEWWQGEERLAFHVRDIRTRNG